jgi:hypothetical protein
MIANMIKVLGTTSR